MNLTEISTVKEIMNRHGIHFQKKYGQNFLVSQQIPAKIAEAAVSFPAEKRGILEIGPGIGTLTRELAKRADKVVALEIDEALIPVLAETLADCPNTKVILQDVMKTDLADLVEREFLSEGYTVAVAANLPYYITTPVLMKLLESRLPFVNITVMIQKEVALRLAADAGDADYGAVTASVAYYGNVERLFSVPAGCFLPAPKVDSAVIRIVLYEKPPVEVTDTELFFRVIRGAFAQRRKTLANSLTSEFPKELIPVAIAAAGLAPNVRGECLSVADFAGLANSFAGLLGR